MTTNSSSLLSADDYFKRILTARVYDVAKETPLEPAPALSQRLGHTVLLKREDQQPVFSFKLRGAYNKMVHLSPEQLANGVICASAGNHAQGVAMSASKLKARAVVVMPVTTPQVKIDAVRHLGGEVVLHGDSYTDAYHHALRLQEEQHLTFVHPFDDPDVIAGQGTVAMEILHQVQRLSSNRLDAVFVAVGGGGLISGVANYIKAMRPSIKVIGVQMNDSDAMMQSVNVGHRVTLPDVGLFSDGTAVKLVGEETFRIVNSGLVDGFMTVDTDAVCAAIKDIFIDTRSIVEPAGALAVAAIKEYAATRRAQGIEGETYAAILCGANMNFDRLRFVAERAEVGEEREALLAVTIPEERGSFRRFCELIGNLPTFGGNGPRNVTEFNYRISDLEVAHVFVGLTTFHKGESSHIAQAFHAHGFEAIDLTHNELAKEHIRYMVGGPSTLAEDERLLRFVFPERPGALLKFLSLMQPNWNISLFHYRNQGADFGRILVGLQVPAAEETEFQTFLQTLGYPFVDETRNPVYHLFLQPKAQGGYEMSPVNPSLSSTSEANLVLPTVIPIAHASLDAELRHCIDFKTKPMGALGRLESLALQIGLVQKTTKIRLEQPQMVVFAADHGITDAKVSAYPQAVTVQMVLNMLAGGAAVNVFARQHGFTLTVVDAGVATPIPTAPVRTQHDPVRLLQRKIGFGTRNMARGPAMTMAQAISALHAGMDVIEHLPGNVIAFGEMGIGNTSSAALLFSRLTDVPLKDTVGRGTGLNDEQLKHKLQVLMEVSRKHHAAKTTLELLSAMGGFEIAMMAGAMIQAAHERRVILMDGFITGAAALVAQKLAPSVVDYMVFCHRSAEVGHRLMLTHFNAQPLLDLDLRLGEGSGALLAWPLLQSASAFLNEMASFETAGVSQASTH